MADLFVCACGVIFGQKVLFKLCRMTGSTVLNPAVGLCLQFIAACAKEDALMFWRDLWPLVVPSALGAIAGGYFMTKIYEPLLLYIKYKDLADESLEENEHVPGE